MDYRFSPDISNIIEHGRRAARLYNSDHIGVEHLLYGICWTEGSTYMTLAPQCLAEILLVRQSTVDYLRQHACDGHKQDEEDFSLSESATRVLKLSLFEAKQLGSNVVTPIHLLLAILKDRENCAADILRNSGFSYEEVLRFAKSRIEKQDMERDFRQSPNDNASMQFEEEYEDFDDDYEDDESFSPKGPASGTAQMSPGNGGAQVRYLDKFGTDLTAEAKKGNTDPVIGRNTEIERVIQILSRRKKNNPVLIGQPGVGKTSIVEGLASRIIEHNVPSQLFNKRVISLNLGEIVAGTKFRGQFEERLYAIIDEVQRDQNIILFIDEIHNIIGAGSASGSMDAANILKPALARGELQCIGATTLDEYRNSIEKDGAMERRFQKVMVEPNTPDETFTILQSIKSKYEDYHNVTYTDDALAACVRLTAQYLTERSFPDKAIDVIDEAGARIQLNNAKVPKEIELQEKKIIEAQQNKSEAVKSQNYELAASYRDKEKDLTYELANMREEWLVRQREHREVVDEARIAEVVSMISGVPVQRMAQSEHKKLRLMDKELKGKVIDQDDAIEKVVKSIQRSRIGMKDPNRPIGIFMFLGSTGVGKTLLAKEVAKYLFGSADSLIRVDMSEFSEEYTVSRLIGSAPGYIGYGEGGLLTERVHRHPYSVVLLDEIEKAHGKIFNLLLQVMDEGRLTDGAGKLIDFRNTVIIMTSNVGTRQAKEMGQGIGFRPSDEADKSYSAGIIQKAMKRTFSPEFLNRIDEVITFNPLTHSSIEKIVDLELAVVDERLKSMGHKLKVTAKAKKLLANKGFDPQNGARSLKRMVQSMVADKIVELLLDDSVKGETEIVADVDKKHPDTLSFSIQQ